MDPLSAYAIAISSVASLIEKIIDGQTPAQKLIIWNWFITDITALRKVFKLDEPVTQDKK